MTDLELILDRFCDPKNKQRASKILRAVEGLGIWEAKELLESCIEWLNATKIHYKKSLGDTTR